MNKIKLGILLGIIVGFIDVVPMIVMRLAWDANLSAFSHWVLVGFLVAIVDIKIKGAPKGLFISVITLIPLAFLVWWNDGTSVIPMSISTVIYGLVLGFFIDKYGK